MESSDSANNDVPGRKCDRRCILHVGKPSEKKPRCDVLPFDEKNWNTVQVAAEKRRVKSQFPKSVYYDLVVSLPQNPDENDGYHVTCYKNFTAVTSTPDASDKNSVALRSNERVDDDAEPSSSGIFPVTCLFCNQKRKKKGGDIELLGSCETLQAAQKIQDAAELLQDTNILLKVAGVDLVAKEAKYHHTCKSAFLLAAGRRSSTDQKKDNIPQGKTLSAVRNIHEYVEKSVIANKRAELLTSVYERYVDFCSSADETPMYRHSLLRNITNRFGPKIKVQSSPGKKLSSILYNAVIADDSVRVAYDYTNSEERLLNRAALILRKQLLNATKKEIPDNPTLNDVRDGDTVVPQPVTNFFQVLFTGNTSDQCGKQVKRRIESISQDALFVVQRGHAKPAKHVTLGMAIRSITGSKKLVDVLNRLGHCLNYSCLEELETATAETIQKRKEACPEDTLVGVPMGLAFDNFDEITQTLSGSDTLHDTMGILYQNLPSDHTNSQKSNETTQIRKTTPGAKKAVKKKRSLTVADISLPPYFGVPKMTTFMYKNTSIFTLPDAAITARKLDLIWMMNHAFETAVLPMWVGFNAIFYKDQLPKQEVRYMPNLNEPITNLSVVRQTLCTTQKCAEECNQEYGIVTYDLAAAKLAMQIQARESPTFDNVFIMMGAFHIEMAFFKAIGKLLAESGGPDMLTETGVLAPGSLNGFLTGKHFNRCKRLHPLLALAFETLHFKEFLEACDFREELHTLISTVQASTNAEEHGLELVIGTDIFEKCFREYSEFTKATISGAHGYTAKFWIMYVEYINIFHQLERAIRTNNIELFVFTLTPIIDLFFATAHINYSRWLTKYQLDLMNIDETHPGLREILEQGVFTVRRTEHDFSRSAVDLTLEQTINADAASRLTGITSFTNNYSARLRWMVTKATRASFICQLQEMTGLTTKQDVTTELRPRRIQRDNDDLQKITKQILDTNNPFENQDASDVLYNISTGKGTTEEIRESLLNVPSTGKTRHREFIQACENDPNKFESPIKKEKLKTFVDGCARNRRTKNAKVAAIKGARDLMGRLLVLSTKKRLDMQHILQYPLVPVPLCLASPEEVMAKTDKSALFDVLESKVGGIKEQPKVFNAYIIDGQFLLHTLPPNLPPTYGGLARTILTQSLRTSAKRVHIAFDNYSQPSIKDTERDRRGSVDTIFSITGPEQRRVPKHLNDALKSKSFKQQLPQFLANEWQDSSYANILGDCEVFLDVSGECYKFQVIEGVLKRETVEGLRNNHEEADTKICLHCLSADHEKGNIVVRATDTDIAVILLYHCNRFQSTLWMDIGTVSKNNRHYVNLTAIGKELGPDLCAALPGFHAFTGSDYTSAFVRKGKVKPLKILEKQTDYQKSFRVMATSTTVSNKTKAALQRFTASMYGAEDSTNTRLNDWRYEKFIKAYGPRGNQKHLLTNLKGIDASGLPPCEDEINPHIKRASFVANIWTRADKLHIEQHPSEENGWQLVDDHYEPIWFEGVQLPESFIPETWELEEMDNEEEDDMDIASSDEDGSSDEDD